MLAVNDIVVSYDGTIQALKGVSLKIQKGEFVSLLGGNGSGKSTTLRTICGWMKPMSGTIEFEGQRIDGLPAEQVLRLGISMVPESRRLFPYMTVKENLLIGAYSRKDADINKDMERMLQLFPSLRGRLGQSAGTLSGGEQQMLATSRALMSKPRLLLMDEPSMGLSPLLVKTVLETTKEINELGTTVLMVEQNANAALQITDRAYILDSGKIVLSDRSAALLNNEQIKAIYLGEPQKRNSGDARPTTY